MDKPTWASDHSLEVCGQYYQGFVDDYKSVLSQHCMATVTTYGVRKSRKNMCFPLNRPGPRKGECTRGKNHCTSIRGILYVINVGMHACTQIILTPEIIKV